MGSGLWVSFPLQYHINNCTVPVKACVKDLGISLNEKLTFV